MTDGTPPEIPRARTRRSVRAGLWLWGWGLHGLALALAQEGLRPALGGHAGLLAIAASVLVVTGLSWLAPELPWWLWGARAHPRQGHGRPSALTLARLVHREGRTRRRAFGDALRLHAALQAPALGVSLALALALRGPAWGLPVLGVACAPWVAHRLRARAAEVLAAHDATLEALGAEAVELGPHTRRALYGVALSSMGMLVSMHVLLTRPTPAPAAGVCPPEGRASLVRLPGPIAGTPLYASAEEGALTLETSEGGGPGAVPLARSFGEAPRTPRWVYVDERRTVVRLTVCAEGPAHGAATTRGHVVDLAHEGYRLDDGAARRVLRGTASRWCATLVLVCIVALVAVGRTALLDPAAHARSGGSRLVRPSWVLALALTLSLAQWAWVALALLER